MLLKKIWIKYILRILLSNVFFHIFQIAKDINRYKVDHTGANTQLGGLKLGNVISEYHGSLKEVVTKLPKAGTKNVIKSIINKDKYLFFVII